MIRLLQLDILFTVSNRPDFDTIALAHDLREARKERGLSIDKIADSCGVPRTEAEHWFRTDRWNAPPDARLWRKVKSLLGIEGWDIAGEIITSMNVYEMGGRAYHSDGLAPTMTVRNSNWIAVGQ